jgi:hypothetical protein
MTTQILPSTHPSLPLLSHELWGHEHMVAVMVELLADGAVRPAGVASGGDGHM